MLKTQTNAYHPEVQFQCISTAFIPFLKYLFVDSSINSNLTCAAISIIGCNFICRPWPSRRYCNKLPWHTNSVTMKIGSSLEQTAYRLTCNEKFSKIWKDDFFSFALLLRPNHLDYFQLGKGNLPPCVSSS